MLHDVLQKAAEAGDLVDGEVDAGQLAAVLEAAVVGEVAADPVDGDVEGGEAGQAGHGRERGEAVLGHVQQLQLGQEGEGGRQALQIVVLE